MIPVGGGGLLAGCALAMKTLRPDVTVIGVEAKACASFSAALENVKQLLPTYQLLPTIID